ncbi:MAG: hypothetical protein HYZ42_13260 [Bacteroidetes bacterium]|nr:hypothetical protein [Bacteroidota bacterium]
MKFIIYLVILIFVLRWISQVFKSNVTYININNHNQEPKQKSNSQGPSITGDIKTKTQGNIGDYVDYEEL